VTGTSRAAFLSYASQDAAAARHICEALRAAGIEVWFDQSELRGGDVWDQKIRREVQDCALFIPIISASTAARHEGYFRLEWNLADQRTQMMARGRTFIVPVCVDDTPATAADVPESFSRVQWTRLPAGLTTPTFVARISQLLSPRDLQSPLAAATVPPSQAPAARRVVHPVALFALAIVIIGGGYLLVDQLLPSRQVTAASVASATREAPGPSAIREKSIAVLPFVDLSEKHDQEYLGDGLAEEILNLLVNVPQLKVIGHASSFQFKGKTDDVRKIGSDLGVAFVVEGSVRRSETHVRVTAELIDTRDGRQRWSDTYDRDTRDMLKVQGEIAASLVRALQMEVTSTQYLPAQGSLRSSDAYDRHLRGWHAHDRHDRKGFEEAAADFRQSLTLDPTFLPAAVTLAMTLRDIADWGLVPPTEGYEQARQATEAALRIDPNSALAHAILGNIHTEYDWNWAAAERESRTALALAPNDADVLIFAAIERLATGDWRAAGQLIDASIASGPLDSADQVTRAILYLRTGRVAEAEETLRHSIQIAPTHQGIHNYLGQCLLLEGKLEAAVAEMQQETLSWARVQGLALAYFALHRSKEADAALSDLMAEHASGQAMIIAEVYAFRGRADQAFEWLDRAYAQKDNNLSLLKGDPLLKTLETDPRYKDFLRKMNLPE
jgi:TolB-like protein/Flp pilus assembly protein TadD